MKTLLYKIPITLLYSRLVVVVIITVCSFMTINPFVVVVLSIYAILSDILDGIIARKLSISNPEMRRLDTKIDTVFWLSCLFYICLQHAQFFASNWLKIVILVSSELAIVVFGKLKFKERISFHTILSKVWALILLWFFIVINLKETAKLSFEFSFWYGLLAQAEILAIIVLIKENHTDIPGILQAIKLKNGQNIKRNPFFNG